MSNTINGWEREKRVHFDEIVTNYDKVRHEYPSAIFDVILISIIKPIKNGCEKL